MVRFALLLSLLIAGCKTAPYVPSPWRSLVPADVRDRPDSLPRNPANLRAGQESYAQYCVGCHAADGAGRRNRPSLRTARVRGETDGEIYWILENGSKGHGMPAWRSLGEGSLWQLVEAIRAMPPAPE